MKKIIFVLFACLILLTGCSQKITEGEIYEKEFLPEETRTIIIPMIHTNGKSLYTTYVPVTHHYPDRWRISIKSIEKNDDGDYDTADYYTTEEVYNRERYFVRLYIDSNDVLHGSVSDAEKVRWFTQKGKLIWEEEEKIHGFDGVPATEYVENKERTCIFEPAMSMIDAYNKAISEKANDVDYFADAYMKILGATLDDDDVEHIRDNRIINFDEDADRLIVDFLQKPDGDTTQEHLIDRLEKLIFQISMVANISDENFGTSSGIAMKYKLQGMSNLAKTKERKFTSGMNRRYKLIFSNPVSGMKEDDWVKLHYHFTPNIPSNVLEESQIAGNLDGIVSQETQLGVLSVVDNVQNEMKKIENEQEKAKTDPVMMQMFGGAGDGKSGVLEEPGNGSKET